MNMNAKENKRKINRIHLTEKKIYTLENNIFLCGFFFQPRTEIYYSRLKLTTKNFLPRRQVYNSI